MGNLIGRGYVGMSLEKAGGWLGQDPLSAGGEGVDRAAIVPARLTPGMRGTWLAAPAQTPVWDLLAIDVFLHM